MVHLKSNLWILLMIAAILHLPAIAQVEISGDQSGTLGPGTFLVVGDITVEDGLTLSLMPGTVFLHNGNHTWNVYGQMNAEGTETDSIRFERQMPIDAHRWGGIRFHMGASNSSTISYSVIDHCYHPEVPNNPGGGIYTNGAALAVTHTRVSNCENSNEGGGIYAIGAPILVDHCLIVDNKALGAENGGGIFLNNSDNSIITNSIIARNDATDTLGICGGGGIRLQTSDAYIAFNQIYDNEAPISGGGIYAYASTAELVNNTITQNVCTPSYVNSRGGGLYAYDNSSYEGKNNIIYGNQAYQSPEVAGHNYFDYTCSSVSLSGTGNIVEDPLFVDPVQDNFHLQEGSPCIDAGDPTSPLDPDGTIADMGALYFPQNSTIPVSIDLTPYDPPIIIPPAGGTFDFNVALMNNQMISQTFDAWIMVSLPNGSPYGPVLGPVNLTLPMGRSLDRDRMQAVPAGAPSGIYIYTGYTGRYPNDIWDEDSFPFEKLSTGEDDFIGDWLNLGEPWEESSSLNAAPSEFPLMKVFPNPFNPTTVMSFELRVPSYVSLRVYNTAGRLVATLVDGWREAGAQEAKFDGTSLASGIYLYRLNAGDFTASGKLMLMK